MRNPGEELDKALLDSEPFSFVEGAVPFNIY